VEPIGVKFPGKLDVVYSFPKGPSSRMFQPMALISVSPPIWLKLQSYFFLKTALLFNPHLSTPVDCADMLI